MSEPRFCPKCGGEIPSGSPAGLCPKCFLQAGMETEPPVDPRLSPTESSPTSASSSFVPPTIEELAAGFPQLEILELLGRGGMGAVYKARQKELDRLVAVKILPPEISRDPTFAERFTREARALARLSHSNIVAVYDFGRTSALPSPSGRGAGGEGGEGTLFYFVMEYVDGVNLRQAIQSGGMSPKEALAIVPQICDALQFAHDEGIVHRDIKPENVLVDKKGRVKIADFGLAKLLGHAPSDVSLTATQQVMGTLRYMAPEQMEGTKSVDHRADIYSLGVVFYELLTGELPIGRFAPPSKKVQIDVRLDEVVLRALEEKPEQRYQHASEVKTDVEAIASARLATIPPAASAQLTVEDQKLIEWAQRRLRGPAIGLTVAAAIDCLCVLGWAVIAYRGFSEIGRLFPKQQADELVMSWLFFSAVLGIPILFGALKMRQLEGYRTSILASILAALPITPGALIGVPIGIWALAVLTHPQMKRAFRLGPEVRAAFAAATPLPAPAEQVKGPATGVLVAGVLAVFLAITLVPASWFVGTGLWLPVGDHYRAESSYVTLVFGGMAYMVVACVLGVLMIVGAVSLRQLQSRWLAVSGAVVAVLPWTPAWLLGLPMGIWALVVLNRRDVDEAFQAQTADLDSLAGRIKTLGTALVVAGWVGVLAAALHFLGSVVAGYWLAPLVWINESFVYSHPATSNFRLLAVTLEYAVFIIPNVLLIVAGTNMKECRSSGWAWTGCVTAMLPLTLTWPLSLPIGLWAMAILTRRDVQAIFAAAPLHEESPGSPDDRLKGPASGLVVAGIVNVLTAVGVAVGIWIECWEGIGRQAFDWNVYILAAGVGLIALGLLIGGLMVLAGLRMGHLQSYGLGVAGSVLGMLVPPGCLIGLPAGIRALVVLSRQEVKDAFQAAGPLDWRLKGAMHGLIWITFVSLAGMALHGGLGAYDHLAPVRYTISDETQLRPQSGAYEHIDAVASGEGRTFGGGAGYQFSVPDEALSRQQLTLTLYSKPILGRLVVNEKPPGCRYWDRKGAEVASDGVPSEELLLKWVDSTGVEGGRAEWAATIAGVLRYVQDAIARKAYERPGYSFRARSVPYSIVQETWFNERIFFVLQHDPPAPFATGKIEIVLEKLGYRYRDREGREIAGDSGLSEEVLLQWMDSAGVDSDNAKARAEAANLLEMAKGAARKSLHELADPVAFTAKPPACPYPSPHILDPRRSVTVDAWVQPVVWAFWAIVWLGGCGLLLVWAGRKTGSETALPPEPAAPASDREIDPATRSMIRRPAVALLVVGVCTGVLGGSHFINWLVRMLGHQPTTANPVLPLVAVAGGIVAVLGAVRMMRVQSYGLAVAGAIGAMVAGGALILSQFGAPAVAVGLWALAVLLSAKVQAAFGLRVEPDRLAATQEPGHQVRWPAVAILALALLDCFGGTMFIWNQMGQERQGISVGYLLNVGVGVAAWVVGLILLVAAVQMLRLRGYRLAYAGGILAMAPVTPLFLAGIPLGIWALAVLRRPEVKAAFAAAPTDRQRSIARFFTSLCAWQLIVCLIGLIPAATPISIVDRGLWGIGLSSSSSRTEGVKVSDIQPGSAAYDAGLRNGDCVLAINGMKTIVSNDLRHCWMDIPVGAEIEIRVVRAEGEQILRTTRGPDAVAGQFYAGQQLLAGFTFLALLALVLATPRRPRFLVWRGGILCAASFALAVVVLTHPLWWYGMHLWQEITYSQIGQYALGHFQRFSIIGVAAVLVVLGALDLRGAVSNHSARTE